LDDGRQCPAGRGANDGATHHRRAWLAQRHHPA
jgi:hypothetical protein